MFISKYNLTCYILTSPCLLQFQSLNFRPGLVLKTIAENADALLNTFTDTGKPNCKYF